MAKYLLLLLINLLPLYSMGQELSVHNIERSQQAVVLLQNNGILPIANLDTISLGLVTGQVPDSMRQTIHHYLNKYLPIQPLAKANTIVHLVNSQKDSLFLQDQQKKWPNARHIVIALQAQQYHLGEINTDAYIYIQDDIMATMSYVAQSIFGSYPHKSRLNQVIHSSYPQNSGLSTQKWNRLSYGAPSLANMNQQLLHDSIRAIVEEGIRAGAFPGVQVLVAKDGQVIFHETYGFHTYDSLQAVHQEDIYDLASITKITSALPALMKWYGEGTFNLDSTLESYLPYFKKSNKGKLTFRAMLAHHAQLRPWIPYWQGTLRKNAKYPWKRRWKDGLINDYKFRKKTLSRDSSAQYPHYIADGLWKHKDFKEKMYKAIKKSPLRTEKGYKYSGLLFYLLPALIEQESGKSYEQYLQQTFYKPLGATTITFNPYRFYSPQRIVPTENDDFFRMMPLRGRVHDEGAALMNGFSANAGLFASTNDLAKLMQLYLNKGNYGQQQLISTNAIEEFTRCQYCHEDNKRGLGFDKPLIEYDAQKSSVAQAASPNSFGHAGYTGTFTWADPDNGLLFVFMSNRVHPTRNNRKIYQLNIRPRIHTVIYDAIVP